MVNPTLAVTTLPRDRSRGPTASDRNRSPSARRRLDGRCADLRAALILIRLYPIDFERPGRSPSTAALVPVDHGGQPSAFMTTLSTVGLVSPLAASLAEIFSTTFSCSALLSLSISALASASLARRSAFSAQAGDLGVVIGGAPVRLYRHQPRSDEQLVAVALDQMLDVPVARARLHVVAKALQRLFDRALRPPGE